MFKPFQYLNIFVVISSLLVASCGGDSEVDNAGRCNAIELTDATAAAKIANGTPCASLNKSPVVVVLKTSPDGKTGLCSGTMLRRSGGRSRTFAMMRTRMSCAKLKR